MPELNFDPAYPIRVSSGSSDNHPTGTQTTQNLIPVMWERNGELWRSYSTDRGLTWAEPTKFLDQSPIYSPRAHVNDRGGFALVWGNPTSERDVWFEEISEIMTISDHLMEIRIQRAFGTTSKGLEMRLANPDRKYDPERTGSAWAGVFYPGSRVRFSVGYGGSNRVRFTGYIDDVESEDRTGYLTVSARGEFKYLLDQHIRRKLSYKRKNRTDHIVQMAIEAGISANEIDVQHDNDAFTEEFDRTRAYMDIIGDHIEALGYDLYEPDEGGLIARDPPISATPVWFYEEEVNMYARTRSWDDDDVYAKVMAYREDIYSSDGKTIKIPGIEWDANVESDFILPPRKTYFIEMGKRATLAQATRAANALARYLGRQGAQLELVTPLNPALEIGDAINVRRKSWNQSGVYIIEYLDDDLKKNLGTSRELAGTEKGGQFAPGQGGGGGFANIIRCRKVKL